MIRRSSLRAVVVVLLAGTLLLPAQQLGAAGVTDIGGSASTSGYTWYSTERTITYWQTDGAGNEVMFAQYYGPSGLRLGAWNCATFALPWGGMRDQSGSWGFVAEILDNGQHFCLATGSTAGSGSFGGRLAWD